MVGVSADTEMESFFTSNFDEIPGMKRSVLRFPCSCAERVRKGQLAILVGTDTSSFEGFGRELLVLIGDHVNA